LDQGWTKPDEHGETSKAIRTEERERRMTTTTREKYTQDQAAWSELLGIVTRFGLKVGSWTPEPDSHGLGPYIGVYAMEPRLPIEFSHKDDTHTDDEKEAVLESYRAEYDEMVGSLAHALGGVLSPRRGEFPASMHLDYIADIHECLVSARAWVQERWDNE
jgi:hypothetical protein